MSGLNLAMAGQTSTYTDTLSVQLEKVIVSPVHAAY